MIPLRDSTRSRSIPIVTVILIILNLYIFFRQSIMPEPELERFFIQYGLIPALFTERLQDYSWFGLLYAPLVTSFFLHGSWFHVLFNMLYLWIFGDNIEDRLGHFRFILFYFLSGILANTAHFLTDINSPIPLVGASGAIAGVLGAYFITFPRARVTSLIFVFIFFTIREIPAVVFLLFWFAINLFQGLSNSGSMSNTAWWAHIGGFLVGMILMLLLKKREPRRTSPY